MEWWASPRLLVHMRLAVDSCMASVCLPVLPYLYIRVQNAFTVHSCVNGIDKPLQNDDIFIVDSSHLNKSDLLLVNVVWGSRHSLSWCSLCVTSQKSEHVCSPHCCLVRCCRLLLLATLMVANAHTCWHLFSLSFLWSQISCFCFELLPLALRDV